MKRSIVAVTASLGLMTAPLTAPVSAEDSKPKQVVEGSVAVPTMAPGDLSNCWSYTHRAFAFPPNANQGITGFDFAVDKKTWKKRFVLKLDEGVGNVDLDIIFFREMDHLIASPSPAEPIPPYDAFEARRPGGEKGRVPKDRNVAVVCIYGGTAEGSEPGARASFTYTAG